MRIGDRLVMSGIVRGTAAGTTTTTAAASTAATTATATFYRRLRAISGIGDGRREELKGVVEFEDLKF